MTKTAAAVASHIAMERSQGPKFFIRLLWPDLRNFPGMKLILGFPFVTGPKGPICPNIWWIQLIYSHFWQRDKIPLPSVKIVHDPWCFGLHTPAS
jgi:hypothetical protein